MLVVASSFGKKNTNESRVGEEVYIPVSCSIIIMQPALEETAAIEDVEDDDDDDDDKDEAIGLFGWKKREIIIN